MKIIMLRHGLSRASLVAAFFVGCISSCGGGPEGPSVEVVTISPDAVELHPTQHRLLTPVATDGDGEPVTGVEFVWSSTASSVATVAPTGEVTAVAVGETMVIATTHGVADTIVVTVTLVPVVTVTLDQHLGTLYVGQGRTLVATPKDSAGTAIVGRLTNWSSSDSSRATVSSGGVVTGVSVGSVVITADVGGTSVKDTVQLTLIPVTSVTLAQHLITLYLGQARTLVATARDSAGTAIAGRVPTWSSSDSTRATVSSGGLVTGLTAGSVIITAEVAGINVKDTVQLTLVPVSTVSLVPAGDTAVVGDTLTSVAVLRDSAGTLITGRTITWAVADSSLLAPIADGVFVVQGQGTTSITASVPGKSKSGTIFMTTCPDSVLYSTNAFYFPMVTGGMAAGSGLSESGYFRQASAWYGGGLLFGTDSANAVLAYNPFSLTRDVTRGWICPLPGGAGATYSYGKVTPKPGNAHPAGLRVVQEVFAFAAPADTNYAILRYTFTNTTGTALTGLRVGYVLDWDNGNNPGANYIRYDATVNAGQVQESDTINFLNRLALIAVTSTGTGTTRGWLNGADPATSGGFFSLLAAGSITSPVGPGDVRQLAGTGPITLPAYGSTVVYFAVTGGQTRTKFTSALSSARSRITLLGF